MAYRRASDTPDGEQRYEVTSPYQAGTTRIRVRMPLEVEPGRRYPVVYLLPVEARDGDRWGDPMRALAACPKHLRTDVIFVVPEFSHLPWYADHPDDPTIRQETYFLAAVVPFIDRTLPVDTRRRSLVGFSKSGWGAWSLLLRQPSLFARAVAWDAPMMMDDISRYGCGQVFGSLDNFQNYRITRLCEATLDRPLAKDRLVLIGEGNFVDEHRRVHELLVGRGIPHTKIDGTRRRHHWESGWLVDALAELALSDGRR